MKMLLLIFLGMSMTLRAGDWPQWFGPQRNGAAEGEAVHETLPDAGLQQVWKHKVGYGFAGPIVADGKVLLFHREGDEAKLVAWKAESGEQLWEFGYPTNYRDGFGFDPGPRSPPTVVDGKVFIYGAEGMVHCLKLADGSPVWKLDAAKDFASPQGFFGRACAPLVSGDVVSLMVGGEVDGKPACVVGLDVDTGSVRWSAGDGEAGYSSPVLAKLEEKDRAFFLSREGLLVLDPLSGEVLLEHHFRSGMSASVNAMSPVTDGTMVFLSACYGVGGLLMDVGVEGKRSEVLWQGEGKLDAHYSTPTLFDGFLYGFHGRQEQGQELRCVRLKDGKVMWSEKAASGTVLRAGKSLLALTEKGELVVINLDATKYSERYRYQVLGAGTRAYPALANGIFYARDKRHLVAIKLN